MQRGAGTTGDVEPVPSWAVPTPMVGRDAEIAAADRLVADTRAGYGGALLVVGEAGIGKTRLVREITTRARRSGCSVLTGHAAPGGGTYRPLAEAVLAYARDGHDIDAPDLRPFSSALSRLAPGWAGEDADRYLDRESAGPDQVLVLGGRPAAPAHRRWFGLRVSPGRGGPAFGGRRYPQCSAVPGSGRPRQPGAAGPLHARRALVTDRTVGRSGRPPRRVAGPARRRGGRRPGGSPRRSTAVRRGADAGGRRRRRAAGSCQELVSGALDSPSGPVPLPRTFAGLVTRRLDALSLDAQRVLRAASVLDQEPDWALLPGVAGLEPSLVSDAARRHGTARPTWLHSRLATRPDPERCQGVHPPTERTSWSVGRPTCCRHATAPPTTRLPQRCSSRRVNTVAVQG